MNIAPGLFGETVAMETLKAADNDGAEPRFLGER